MVTWNKKVNNSDVGDATHVGGDSWDSLVDLINNYLLMAEVTRTTTADSTTQAGASSLIVGDFEIGSGFVHEILSDGVLEIT